eukprot:871099-Pelagomonas_calceolata.AAC.12
MRAPWKQHAFMRLDLLEEPSSTAQHAPSLPRAAQAGPCPAEQPSVLTDDSFALQLANSRISSAKPDPLRRPFNTNTEEHDTAQHGMAQASALASQAHHVSPTACMSCTCQAHHISPTACINAANPTPPINSATPSYHMNQLHACQAKPTLPVPPHACSHDKSDFLVGLFTTAPGSPCSQQAMLSWATNTDQLGTCSYTVQAHAVDIAMQCDLQYGIAQRLPYEDMYPSTHPVVHVQGLTIASEYTRVCRMHLDWLDLTSLVHASSCFLICNPAKRGQKQSDLIQKSQLLRP